MATKHFWAGVDIGGTKTAIVLSAAPPAVLHRAEFPTLPADGPDPALRSIFAALRQALAAQGPDAALEGIGVSCGSPLDALAGVIQAPPNLWTWVDVPIVSILQKEFGVPCHLENDANAGAVAEHRFGTGRGTDHMLFLTMGTGFGAGIIANGKLYRGATGMAGEIGHVRLTSSGPIGYHKAGSVEGWVSGGGLAQVAATALHRAQRQGRHSALAERFQSNGQVSARDIAEAARAGDPLAKRVIRSTGVRLGRTLAILVDLFNPQRIVIGGLAMRIGEPLLAPARATLAREALPGSVAACQVVPAQLGESIGDAAALAIAMGI
jgi:glucokinase